MASLNANDVSIYKRTATGPDVYKLIVCADSASLNIDREVITTKTKCGTTTKKGTESWSMDFSGEIKTDPTTTELSEAAILTDLKSSSSAHYAIKDAADTWGYEGNAHVTNLKIDAGVDDTVKFSFTLSGDGDVSVMP
ncbi:MAG TPA: phage tail tube protein [Segetibacter sp.]|jgi:predicted secreted protein